MSPPLSPRNVPYAEARPPAQRARAQEAVWLGARPLARVVTRQLPIWEPSWLGVVLPDEIQDAQLNLNFISTRIIFSYSYVPCNILVHT